MIHPDYAATIDKLVERIMALPNEKVLACKSAWDLFKIGLQCDDLGPSLAQAMGALAEAKRRIAP